MAGERIEELLGEHRDWVRRLAHHLAGEAGDDVAQDAWLAAQRSPPAAGRAPRPWLARIVRNLVANRRRHDGRQRRREAALAVSAASAGVDEIYERVELERVLAAEVMALPEPLRAVVILRYFEGLDSARIGTMLELPPGTVRWRLKTALEKLRARLDERHGGNRRAWIVILLPRAGGRPAALAVAAGTALVIAVGLATGWPASGPSERERVTAARAGLSRAANPASEHVGQSALAGLVRDAAGAAVADAVVIAGAIDELAGARPLAPVRTDRDGRFTLARIAPGPHRVSASKVGVGSASVAVDEPREREIVMTLVPAGARLAGRTLDSGGGAIASATVLARLTERFPPVTFAAIADGDGKYALELPVGRYELEATAAGYAPARYGLFLHLPMQRDFRLHPAARIAGRVRLRSGEVAPGAQVVALTQPDDREGRARVVVTADADGGFEVADLDPGSHRLLARTRDAVSASATTVTVGLAGAAEIELTLERGRQVRGTVRGHDGAAIAAAQVIALDEAGGHAATDHEGRFVLAVRPGTPAIAGHAPGFAPARVDLPAAEAPVEIVLGAQATVSGRVRDEAGNPVAGVHLALEIRGSGARAGVAGRGDHSDGAGRFRFERVYGGSLELVALHARGTAALTGIAIAAGEHKELELTLTPAASVHGRVRRADGAAAAGAHVYAFAPGHPRSPVAATVADPDGGYRFDTLPAGEVAIRAAGASDEPYTGLHDWQARADQASLALAHGDVRTVDLIVMDNDHAIQGRVVDPAGRAVAGAIVRAASDGVTWAPGYGRTPSDENGAFTIEHLGPGYHTLTAIHPELGEHRRDGVLAGARAVELRLEPRGTLTGGVLDQEGRPARATLVARRLLEPDASVWQRREHAANRHAQAEADAAGAFSLSLPPGRYELVAYAGGKIGRRAPIALLPGATKAGLRLVLGDAVTVKGRLVDHASGRPVAGATIAGSGTASGRASATSDADGAFTLAGLPPGEAAFAILSPAHLTEFQERAGAAAGELDLGEVRLYPGPRVELHRAGSTLTGLVFLTRDGLPVIGSVYPGAPGARAGARPGDEVVAIDGRDVRGLPAGVIAGLVATAGSSVQLEVVRPGERTREIVVRKLGFEPDRKEDR